MGEYTGKKAQELKATELALREKSLEKAIISHITGGNITPQQEAMLRRLEPRVATSDEEKDIKAQRWRVYTGRKAPWKGVEMRVAYGIAVRHLGFFHRHGATWALEANSSSVAATCTPDQAEEVDMHLGYRVTDAETGERLIIPPGCTGCS